MTQSKLNERYLGEGARSYNAIRETSDRWKLENEIVARHIAPHRGRTVLDLPVGTGRFVQLYKDLDCTVIGIDFSPDMLDIAKTEAARIGYKKGRFEVGDATAVDPKSIAASVGVCIRFLNWLPSQKAERAFFNIAAACEKELVVSLTSIDEAMFDEKRREAVERRLANAHSRPSKEGLPPNGPHSWTAFKRWVDAAGYFVADSDLVLQGKDHLKNEIHRLVRR